LDLRGNGAEFLSESANHGNAVKRLRPSPRGTVARRRRRGGVAADGEGLTAAGRVGTLAL